MSFGCLLTNDDIDLWFRPLGYKLESLGIEYRENLEWVQNLIGPLVIWCECSMIRSQAYVR